MGALPSVREFLTTPGHRVLTEGGWYDDDRREAEETGQLEQFEAQHQTSTTQAIVNELVKSYGFEMDRNGSFSWSLDRIGRSFKEEPLWTTIDYLTLTLPVAKWGSSLFKMSRASTVVGKAYQAGRFAERAPTTLGGRAAERAGGVLGMRPGLGAAIEAERYKPGRLTALSNPIGLQIDDEYLSWAGEFGAAPFERRGIAQMLDRERRLGQSIWEKQAEDVIRGFERAGLSDAQRVQSTRFLHGGIEPADARVLAELGEQGRDAYQRQWTFRNAIHEESFSLGLISEETYLRNLKTYAPRIYEEYQRLAQAMPHDEAMRRLFGTGAGASRYKARKLPLPDPELTQILDPAATTESLAKAAYIIQRQKYAQALGGSVIAKRSDEVAATVQRILDTDDVAGARMLGMVPKGLRVSDDAVRGHLAQKRLEWEALERTDTMSPETVARLSGWRSVDDLYAGTGSASYLDRLPEELRDKWIDPAVAKDMKGILDFSYGSKDWYKQAYQTFLGVFRASKTAYNPATGVRNWLGAAITEHFVNGGLPKFMPTKAIKEFMANGPLYEAFVKTGHAFASFDSEIRDALKRSGAELVKDGRISTALDFLGDGRFAKMLQGPAGKMERGYRLIDELWKFEAWIGKRDTLMKAGHSADEAADLASVEVAKFMQTFATHSPLGDAARNLIPFSSFTTEALRIWKNVLVEKPHLAFFWNNTVEAMGEAFGAMAGFSHEELDDAKGLLPSYMNNKKLMALPFKVDGKPIFLDFSYLIPMANLVEAEQANSLFFPEVYDPTQNPLVGAAVAVGAGYDTFKGKEIQPRFTERQLGIPVEGDRARRAVGLAEYMAQLLLPPLVPPGYAGVNLLEAARGQRHAETGVELERSVLQTVAANVAGMRTYQPDVSSQILNVRKEQEQRSRRITQEWDRFEFAAANGDLAQMERSRRNIVGAKLEEVGDEKSARAYFDDNVDRHSPAKMKNLSTKQIEEILARSNRVGTLSEDEKRLQAELMIRYQKGASRRKEKK